MIEKNILPVFVQESKILTINNLAQLCEVDEIPVISASFTDDRLKNIIQYYSINPEEMEKEIQYYAKELLENGKIDAAWQVLLTIN